MTLPILQNMLGSHSSWLPAASPEPCTDLFLLCTVLRAGQGWSQRVPELRVGWRRAQAAAGAAPCGPGPLGVFLPPRTRLLQRAGPEVELQILTCFEEQRQDVLPFTCSRMAEEPALAEGSPHAGPCSTDGTSRPSWDPQPPVRGSFSAALGPQPCLCYGKSCRFQPLARCLGGRGGGNSPAVWCGGNPEPQSGPICLCPSPARRWP